VLLLDAAGRVLLFHVSDPHVDAPALWVTPGGALEPSESWEEAALRELEEETGLTDVQLGPWVWKRHHVWRWGEHWNDSEERFYLVRLPSAEISMGGMSAEEQDVIKAYRWWSVDELAHSTDQLFVPRRIPDLLRPLVAGHIPTEPVDTGV
jgi:8-oxo-dGTP pyrophosphatase MutT (NUDIX family)